MEPFDVHAGLSGLVQLALLHTAPSLAIGFCSGLIEQSNDWYGRPIDFSRWLKSLLLALIVGLVWSMFLLEKHYLLHYVILVLAHPLAWSFGQFAGVLTLISYGYVRRPSL